MTTKQKVLDMWIEKGAMYRGKRITERNITLMWDYDHRVVVVYHCDIISDNIWYYDTSTWDLFYWRSNIREVMFPDKTMTKPTIGRKNISVPMHHKMNSLLSEDPREYIATHSPLFADDKKWLETNNTTQ